MLRLHENKLKRREQIDVARWSRGMIRASGARGPGFKSRTSPISLFYFYDFCSYFIINEYQNINVKAVRIKPHFIQHVTQPA